MYTLAQGLLLLVRGESPDSSLWNVATGLHVGVLKGTKGGVFAHLEIILMS